MKTNTRLFCFSVLFLLLNSCAKMFGESTTQLVDNQWLQDLACEFPCWQQITPQKTNFDEVMSILSQANIQIEFTGRTEKEIDFQFQNNIAGSIHNASNGSVDIIILDVHYQKITLGDLEQIIGQPDKVNIGKVLYGGDKCNVVTLFQKKGVLLDLFPIDDHSGFFSDVSDCKVEINRNSQVFRIILIGDIDDSEFWRNAYSSLKYGQWKGYDTYLNSSN